MNFWTCFQDCRCCRALADGCRTIGAVGRSTWSNLLMMQLPFLKYCFLDNKEGYLSYLSMCWAWGPKIKGIRRRGALCRVS